jgi:TRAP-type C4-dicarboxylate transport system permease small subunit
MALDILIQVSMLIVFIIFFGGSIDCVKATIISGQRSPALQIPMTIPYLATSIGFFLAIIRSVQSSFQSIKLLLTGGDIKVDAMTAVEEELDEASQQLFRNQKGGN